MRIIQVGSQGALARLMREIKVDPYGIEIMLPKAVSYVIKLNSLSSIQANILKQEMLSFGGDVAVTRQALTGKARHTDCLIIGSLSQYRRLVEKLKCQPFGLAGISSGLADTVASYEKTEFTLRLGRFRLTAGSGRTRIWGIVNLTPDSFSGDGLYALQSRRAGKSPDPGYICEYIHKLIEDGADVIDIGGESTRPGSMPVPLKEETARVIPVLKKIAKKINVPVSIDTYKPAVAEAAVDCGASLINDISGLNDPRMIRVAARKKCGVVLMHSKGKPRTMQVNPCYGSLMDEILAYLRKAAARAEDAGIAKDRIIIDPGLGFGKTALHNLQILKQLGEFRALGKPILIGPSRKAFIGKILNAPVQERSCGTLCVSAIAATNGASFLRVHDVREAKQAITVANSINNAD